MGWFHGSLEGQCGDFEGQASVAALSGVLQDFAMWKLLESVVGGVIASADRSIEGNTSSVVVPTGQEVLRTLRVQTVRTRGVFIPEACL